MKTLLLSAAVAALAASPSLAQTLRVALATHTPGLDAQQETGNNGAPKLYLIYDALIERDAYAVPLQFRPGLATEWEQIAPTVWELRLREGVLFHDGNVLEAEDVAFTLNRMFRREQPEFAAAWGRWFYNFKEVEVVDPLTVRIHTHREEPLFETLISARSAGITSRRHYETLGFDAARLQPVGTGPYRVTEFVSRDRTVMERFDDHWGDPAPFERIEFQLVSEVASRVTGLVNDEFDLVTNIPPDQAPSLAGDHVATLGITWPMFHVWIIRQTSGPTEDPRVRKAMRLCTDRQALVDGLWGGLAAVPHAHQFAEYGEPLYMPDLRLVRHDPDEARALLAEAGYDGAPIVAQFTQSYYLYGDLAAQVIQQQWAECGLNLVLQQIERYDNSALHIRAWSNPMYYPDPMGAMDTHWSTSSWTYRDELWRPSHPEWESTYETARFATDVMERRDAYRRLLELSEEESGWILLYQPHELYGMRADISFEIPPTMRPYTLPLRAGQVQFDAN